MNEYDLTDLGHLVYSIPGWDGEAYRIGNPKTVYIKEGEGVHRILDTKGNTHLIPFPSPGTTLQWVPRVPGTPLPF